MQFGGTGLLRTRAPTFEPTYSGVRIVAIVDGGKDPLGRGPLYICYRAEKGRHLPLAEALRARRGYEMSSVLGVAISESLLSTVTVAGARDSQK